MSPGGTAERIFLFYASVIPGDRIGVGGVLHEHEDIRVLTMRIADALAKLRSGEIADAKTIIGLLWLQLNKTGLG